MKIPGYRYLVDSVLPELKKELPKLAKSVKFTGFDVGTGVYIDEITEDYFSIRLSYGANSIQFTYEEMLLDKKLRKILNYLLMWHNKLKYDGYFIVVDSGNSTQRFSVDISDKYGYNVIYKSDISSLGSRANKGIDIEPLLLASMPLIRIEREEFLRI